MPSKKFRITYNAPVVLTFTFAAVTVHLLGFILGDGFSRLFVARPFLHSVGDYVGLFTHVLGHGSWGHLVGNFTMILLLGPILEERHGSVALLMKIVVTAVVTGLIQAVFFNDGLLGASGIVFMFILLASTANIKDREIPLTFIAVATLYLGGELVDALRDDRISQMAHLVGGLAGACFGFLGARLRGTSRSRSPDELARTVDRL